MFHSAPAITALQDGSSEYPGWNAFRQVRVSDPPSVRVGQWPPVDVMPGPNGLYAMGEDGRIRMVVSWYEWDRSGLVHSVLVPAPSLEHDVSMGLRHVSMMS